MFVIIIHILSDNYVKMILADGSFIIVFFLTYCKPKEWTGEDDLTLPLISTVRKDIRLLENQLPLFVINKIYNFVFASRSNLPSFTKLAIKFFAWSNSRKISLNSNLKIRHFIDLLRTFFIPQLISQGQPQRNRGIKVTHLYTASQLGLR